MAYDAAHGHVVMFGGKGGSNETWIWEPTLFPYGGVWFQLSPANSPPARWLHAMAYDAVRSQVVLFGGTGINGDLNDTWTWDGINWTQRFPATSPPPTDSLSMAYDAAAQNIVASAGDLPGNPPFGTWTWDGTNWTQQHPANPPAGRYAAGMAYDAAHSQVILFGGMSADGSGFLKDTWAWTQPSPSGVFATFAGTDTTTLGSWRGVYGQDGKYIPANWYQAASYSSFNLINVNERL